MAAAAALSDAVEMRLYVRHALLHIATRSVPNDGSGPLLCRVPVRWGKAFGCCLPAKLGSTWRRIESVVLPGHQQEAHAVRNDVH